MRAISISVVFCIFLLALSFQAQADPCCADQYLDGSSMSLNLVICNWHPMCTVTCTNYIEYYRYTHKSLPCDDNLVTKSQSWLDCLPGACECSSDFVWHSSKVFLAYCSELD